MEREQTNQEPNAQVREIEESIRQQQRAWGDHIAQVHKGNMAPGCHTCIDFQTVIQGLLQEKIHWQGR